jgi:hypothetical protein
MTMEQRGGAVDVRSDSRAFRRPLRPSDRRPEFGWVILADPEGNEFDVEISLAELDAARASAQ